MTTHMKKLWWDLYKQKLVEQAIPETEIYKREWVGLTDEELREAYLVVSGNEWCLGGMSNAESFYEAIEAKLKEKNT